MLLLNWSTCLTHLRFWELWIILYCVSYICFAPLPLLSPDWRRLHVESKFSFSSTDKFTSYMCMPLSRKITEIILVIKNCYDCTWLFFSLVLLLIYAVHSYWHPWKITGFISIPVTSQNQYANYFIIFFLSGFWYKVYTSMQCVFQFSRDFYLFFFMRSFMLKMQNQIVFGLGMLTCMDWM